MFDIRPENKRLKISIEEIPVPKETERSLIFLPESYADPNHSKEEYVVGIVEGFSFDCENAHAPNCERVVFPKRFMETISIAGVKHAFVSEENVIASWLQE